MNNKREQDYTLRVAHKMKIDTDNYLEPNRSFENVLYDTDGIDKEIESINPKIYELKDKYFLEHKKVDENEDANKINALIVAKDKTDKKLYDLVISTYGI